MASEAVATVALIVELSLAPMRTSRALTMVLSSTYALALFRMTLVASAPAPLTAMPAVPAMPAASEAAPVSAVILADSVAESATSPSVLCRSSACATKAATSLEISL